MSENITLTSGQAVGLTGLSMQTIQRYIRQYPMGFSEQARQPKKGRRLNGDDIKNLLLINSMLHTKGEKQHIEAALTGAYESPDLSLFEVQNLLMMFNTIVLIKNTLEQFYKQVMFEQRDHRNLRNVIYGHAKHINALKFDVSRLKIRRAILGDDDFVYPHPQVNEAYRQAREEEAKYPDELDV